MEEHPFRKKYAERLAQYDEELIGRLHAILSKYTNETEQWCSIYIVRKITYWHELTYLLGLDIAELEHFLLQNFDKFLGGLDSTEISKAIVEFRHSR